MIQGFDIILTFELRKIKPFDGFLTIYMQSVATLYHKW